MTDKRTPDERLKRDKIKDAERQIHQLYNRNRFKESRALYERLFPLHAAVKRGKMKEIVHALCHVEDINDIDIHRNTALSYAQGYAHSVDVVKLLLARGADPNRSKYDKPLVIAVYIFPLHVPILLDAGADPNTRGSLGGNVLADAIHAPKDEITIAYNVHLLLSAGAKPDENAFSYAISRENADVMSRLLDYYDGDPSEMIEEQFKESPLYEAPHYRGVYNLRMDWIIHSFFKRDARVGGFEGYPTTPQIRMILSREWIIRGYVDRGYHVNIQDKYGNTPLHELAKYDVSRSQNRAEVLLYLLSQGADPEIKNYEGKTPLDVAVHWKTDVSFAAVLQSHSQKQ